MDKMNVKLTSKFMRCIVSKLISRAIYKKLGYKVDIELKELDIRSIDGDTTIQTNVELKLNSSEFRNIMEDIGAN